MAVTETEITVATVATVATVETMEDIHPEVVATQRLTEDINTKCSSKCSNIYRVYYKRGIHRATFIITHGIVSVWNSKNATVIVSDDNFSTIEFWYRSLLYLIVLGHLQLNDHRMKRMITRLTLKTGSFHIAMLRLFQT